jgi:hypothetical protein
MRGRVVGTVKYAEGDGVKLTIPPGPCEITVTAQDATIAWSEGDTRGATAIPLDQYKRYVDHGEIVVES